MTPVEITLRGINKNTWLYGGHMELTTVKTTQMRNGHGFPVRQDIRDYTKVSESCLCPVLRGPE